MSQKPFTLYGIALSGPTYKAGLMLSLCGEKFAYRHINLREGAHKTPEHIARNRYGQVPALQHGDMYLCQSAAILEYLSEETGKFAGEGTLGKQRVREWLFWDADRLSPPVYRTRAIKRGFFQAPPAVAEIYQTGAEQALQVLEDNLKTTPFLVGAKPTIADIACYGVIAFAGDGEAGLDLGKFPSVAAWAKRIEALPGFKPPYDLLPMQDAA
jgi:glutathione S-transferase